jgi:hypothetical protein
LEKIPKRKAKCKSCKKSVYPRKEPLSGEQRLYREGDLFLLEELKALTDGFWNDWYKVNKSVLNARKDLAKEWKVDEVSVSIADARWRKSHTDLADATNKQDWSKVYSAYEALLRQVQRERSQDKTPLVELVAGFIVTGYGHNRLKSDYRMDPGIGKSQTMLIEQLTPEPDSVYALINDTQTAKTYCHLLGVSLETVIKRYKDELNDEAELLRKVMDDRNTETVVQHSFYPTKNTTPPEPKLTRTSTFLIFIIAHAVLGVLAFYTYK